MGRVRRGRPSRPGGPGDRKNPLPGGNDPFTCAVCGTAVRPLARGGARNHCPECLRSLHVDVVPGDRAESCGGVMDPVALEGSAASGFSIVFRCRRCGGERRNKAASDDPVQPDRWDRLIEVAAQPPSSGPGPRKRGRSGYNRSQ